MNPSDYPTLTHEAQSFRGSGQAIRALTGGVATRSIARCSAACALIALVGAIVLIWPRSAASQASTADTTGQPLTVRVQVTRTPHFVGQSLVLQVSTVAGAERPAVTAPKVANADVRLAGTDMKPISTSGIGNVVTEKNLFITRFRIIPLRAGKLTIPAIPARLADRSGASHPLHLNIQAPPQSGRTAAFLGGVGTFEVTADVSAPSIRLGQEFEYRLHVDGPAARSMSKTPVVEIPGREQPGPRIEPLPGGAVDDPPSRLFRYRIRPSQAGALVIPPVAIAAFDPQVNRYITKVSPSVPVRVVEIARFDPATLDYRLPVPAASPWKRVLAGSIPALLVGLVGAWIWNRLSPRRVRRRSDQATRRLLDRLVQGLDSTATGTIESARWITEGLAEYLHVRIGRPRGALTPGEARAAIARSEASETLGERAERLVAHCDHAQFAETGAEADRIVTEAREFLTELRKRVGSRGAKNGEFEKPREAVKTAAPLIPGGRKLPLLDPDESDRLAHSLTMPTSPQPTTSTSTGSEPDKLDSQTCSTERTEP